MFIPNVGGSIIPNHLLKRAFTAGLGNTSIGNVNININDPVVRSDEDIPRLAKAVADELTKRLNRQANFGGNLAL